MFGFLSQVMDLVINGRLHPYLLFFLFTWLIFLLRLRWAGQHRPIKLPAGQKPAKLKTIAFVMSFKDKPDMLRRCIDSIHAQATQFNKVVMVMDSGESAGNMAIARGSGFVVYVDEAHNKRDAFAGAVRAESDETYDVIAMLSGDTIYPPDALSQALVAFWQPKVGAVALPQRIYRRWANLIRVFADIMYGLRFALTYPALSSAGTLLCTTGETAFFRRSIIVSHLSEFLAERFLGRRCIIGDDRFLTSQALRDGFDVVLQSVSRPVLTDCPNSPIGFIKQQVRWYRSNQRYSTKTLLGWIPGRPRLKIHLLAFMLLPYLWIATLIWWWFNTQYRIYPVLVLMNSHLNWSILLAVWMVCFFGGAAIKLSPHLVHNWLDWLVFPFYVLFSTFVILPVFVYAGLTVGDQGSWTTKRSGRAKFGGGMLMLIVFLTLPLLLLEAFAPMSVTGGAGSD